MQALIEKLKAEYPDLTFRNIKEEIECHHLDTPVPNIYDLCWELVFRSCFIGYPTTIKHTNEQIVHNSQCCKDLRKEIIGKVQYAEYYLDFEGFPVLILINSSAEFLSEKVDIKFLHSLTLEPEVEQ